MGQSMERRGKFVIEARELQRLYQFYSCAKIGKMFNVNPETVRKKLHSYEIPLLKCGGRRAFDPPRDVLSDLYQRMSMREIAEHFGVGETVVFHRLKEHGIELKEFINHRLKRGRVFTEEHKRNISLANRARNAVGEKNPNWKGGATLENLRARTSLEAREWRKGSLKRTNYECEECGRKEGATCECCGTRVKLHVHHVHSFSKYPDKRYDPENSEVLCSKCHYARHSRKIA